MILPPLLSIRFDGNVKKNVIAFCKKVILSDPPKLFQANTIRILAKSKAKYMSPNNISLFFILLLVS